MLDRLTADVRYALRQLMRAPISTLVAMVSLAVGITVAVTAFSLINALVFRPLPVPSPDRVVHVFASEPQDFMPEDYPYGVSSYADVPDYAGTGAFSGLVAWLTIRTTLTANDVAPARLPVTFVSPGFFDILGVTIPTGRRLASEHAFEMVITDQYRRRTFADGEPVIGATVTVNGIALTVIGVAPAPFRGLDLQTGSVGWVPAGTLPAVDGRVGADLADRSSRYWQVAGRLAPGVTQESAAGRLAGVAHALADAYPAGWRSDGGKPRQITVLTQQERALADRDLASVLAVLAVAVGIIVVLACTNVAGLLLAQSISRRHEIAVRLALGASRRRLSAQLLTESLILAVLGSALGLLGSRGAVWIMSRSHTFDPFDMSLDWRVLATTTALCFVCALLFGITPAGQTLRVDVKSGLTGQGVLSERGGVRGRLIALQVCLSCMLVVLGLHASRGVVSVARAAPGVEMNGLMVATLDMDTRAMDSVARRHYLEHAITTMRALPGVRHTGLASQLPTLERVFSSIPLSTPAGPIPAGLQWVDGDYFETMGYRLIAGALPRHPAPAGGRRDAVVNLAFAKRLGGQPIGTVLERQQRELTIVAVVDDAGARDSRPSDVPVVYDLRSGWARSGGPLYIIARVQHGTQAATAARFVPAIRDRYPALVPPTVTTLRAQLDEFFSPQRYIANTALTIGAMQLVLAALGLYSLLLYATLARTREIGLRMALGARAHGASWSVMKDGLRYVLAGAALGLALGVPAALFASRNFIGGDATDPLPFAAALTGIAIATAAAACIPARRAARVQPMAALRMD